ncbi:uncharacterized protein UTRI_02914 [Ustilago trichophora]|uniref:Uncharacterized protein n=1 Tax=Ustilago trichophora TaxID=86804 RepID=A0A5C3ERG5_9BASI|nr:uncharacterized protein UTRI_02914 [Ustilago trichophora]
MVQATSIASMSDSPAQGLTTMMSLALSPPSNASSLTLANSPANSTTTPPQQLETKVIHHHHHHLLEQQHLFDRAKLENHLLSLTPAFLTSTFSSLQQDKENSPPSNPPQHHLPNRRVLRDITQALNDSNGLNPSTLALIHARSNRTIHHNQQRQHQHQQAGISRDSAELLRKRVVGYQHRKKTIPRRGAISLSSQEAMQLSRQLSWCHQDFPAVKAVKKKEEVETLLYVEQEEKEEVGGKEPVEVGLQVDILPLDNNLFLVTRADGHTLTCPPSRTNAPRCLCD